MSENNRISVIEEGKKIPLEEVLNMLGLSLNSYNKTICPFHSDNNPSLSIWKPKNIYKCFTCGAKGDVITFWNNYYSINDYFIAAADLCYTMNKISISDYENILDWKNKGKPTKKERDVTMKNNYINIINSDNYDDILIYMKGKENSNIATDEELDTIYSLFIECTQDFYGERLNKNHKNSLKKDRFLTEEEIESTKYFSFPYGYIEDFMDVFLSQLDKKGIDKTILSRVPGFYYDKSKQLYLFLGTSALAIPKRNIDNQIIRIQLRYDNEEGSNKYGWFSSRFAEEESELYKDGTSSGSIATMFIPTIVNKDYVVITEGHFKAKKISNEKNCISISVQGVANWKSIISVFDKIVKRYVIKKVVIAFDSDFKFNNSVYSYSKRLSDSLKNKGYTLFYMTWKYSYGKGIDDAINNGYLNYIRIVPKHTMDSKMEYIDYIIKNAFPNISKEDNIRYFEILEDYTEESLKFFKDYLISTHNIHPELLKTLNI